MNWTMNILIVKKQLVINYFIKINYLMYHKIIYILYIIIYYNKKFIITKNLL